MAQQQIPEEDNEESEDSDDDKYGSDSNPSEDNID